MRKRIALKTKKLVKKEQMVAVSIVRYTRMIPFCLLKLIILLA